VAFGPISWRRAERLWILTRCVGDPEEAIVRAVNDTTDNDTVGAIVGAAVGALHGELALPPVEQACWTHHRQTDNAQYFA